jgi:hypothetical protein
MLLVGLLSLLIVRQMYVQFEGVVVARLPFTPISFLSNLTHYGIEGDDYS